MARQSTGGLLPIEAEMQRERAYALRGTAEKLERLLSRLRQTDQVLDATVGIDRRQLLAERERLREEADKQRWYLVVQREAIGLFNHDDVMSLYPIPDRRLL